MVDLLGNSVDDDARPVLIICDVLDLQANVWVFSDDLNFFPSVV